MIRHPVRLMRMVLIAVLSLSVTAAAGTLGWWAILNSLGPSTEYHSPYIEGPDGKLLSQENGAYVAHLGERIYVRYFIVRHKINGDCLLHVYRYGENIGGPEAGKRHLLDYVELQFRGEDELLRTALADPWISAWLWRAQKRFDEFRRPVDPARFEKAGTCAICRCEIQVQSVGLFLSALPPRRCQAKRNGTCVFDCAA